MMAMDLAGCTSGLNGLMVSESGVHGKHVINKSTLNPNVRLLHRIFDTATIQTSGLNHKDSLVACDLVHF